MSERGYGYVAKELVSAVVVELGGALTYEEVTMVIKRLKKGREWVLTRLVQKCLSIGVKFYKAIYMLCW